MPIVTQNDLKPTILWRLWCNYAEGNFENRTKCQKKPASIKSWADAKAFPLKRLSHGLPCKAAGYIQ